MLHENLNRLICWLDNVVIKMKKKVGTTRGSKKPRKKWNEIIINVLTLVFFAGVFTWMIASLYNEATTEIKAEDQYLGSLPSAQDTIAHSKVCMVDDFFQGDVPSLAVSINNKTYYGCSAKANHDLATTDSLRFAIDPVSKKKVDKATAIIALHPDKDGKVMYFGSKDTYNKHLNVLKKAKEKK